MRVLILAVGRMKQGPERELVARYLDRAVATGKSLGLTGFSVTELTESRAGSAAARKAEEARTLTAQLPGGIVVALDERGKSTGSEEFAKRLGRWRDDGKPAVTFVIGGADGLDPGFVSAADMTLGFSTMTWPHQLVRIMLAEQLYRTTTILSGHPYHRE
ncbi:MAG: 23S rRNA (pseudouridine(1915)-N(3))-methyltransferase RlmH [Devosia sp.]|uniref:23S rRNA (pseudouridine(1915)-N(3))-methyltransferase RlmH n=1 Tax=Devosia sp. 66-22 TaxID=1895753 RepID=UPI000929A67F|nr:23S rRNA (pseudouridine(1915)-N(3))-methyltransferase RlmH [Devosia sp. 66-22]MBN9347164.1 23S rRNA (pseudouridine(1915)-N(3))-methyltransferase RlmH [Devosia sp.]OJX46500.1 MAG: 23S rRNA (pseudouridine(1915)-N(3))-methyltransferase RlmH [Devosia sp. 66-22]